MNGHTPHWAAHGRQREEKTGGLHCLGSSSWGSSSRAGWGWLALAGDQGASLACLLLRSCFDFRLVSSCLVSGLRRVLVAARPIPWETGWYEILEPLALSRRISGTWFANARQVFGKKKITYMYEILKRKGIEARATRMQV